MKKNTVDFGLKCRQLAKLRLISCTGTDEVLFVSEEEYYEKFMEDLDRINHFASPEEEEELYQDHSYYMNIQSNDTKNDTNGNQPLYSGAKCWRLLVT